MQLGFEGGFEVFQFGADEFGQVVDGAAGGAAAFVDAVGGGGFEAAEAVDVAAHQPFDDDAVGDAAALHHQLFQLGEGDHALGAPGVEGEAVGEQRALQLAHAGEDEGALGVPVPRGEGSGPGRQQLGTVFGDDEAGEHVARLDAVFTDGESEFEGVVNVAERGVHGLSFGRRGAGRPCGHGRGASGRARCACRAVRAVLSGCRAAAG